jgi:predicted TPR repeat methyltransferase
MVRDAPPLFLSSGDLIADRRYDHAMALRARGDLADAANLFDQTVELAPHFASAWFALGETRAQLGDYPGAVAAFRQACAADPQDRHGAGLHLVRLAEVAPEIMTPGYVRSLFDQYAPRFDAALQALSYCAPALLVTAVEACCGAQGRCMHFGTLLDLGCGTGLAGAAFRPYVDWLIGLDLSPAMIKEARAKGLYDKLHVGDIGSFLAREADRDAACGLIIAADVLSYMGGLEPVCAGVARVLAPDGIFAFTVETHPGDGIVLGDRLRYAHGAAHVRAAVAAAGLALLDLAERSTRTERRLPVPGLLAVAARPITSTA